MLMKIDANAFMPMEMPVMTETHEEERLMLNEIYELLAQEPLDAELIDTKLDALLHHTEVHFERENRNMLIIEFRPYPVHKDEHDMALSAMKAVINQWKLNRNLKVLRAYLETELPAWLQQHIATMDMITARFLKMYQDKGGELDFS
ncbi:hemerythrin family protein [Thiothrix nivea]|uniref:Hemerythrin-like metal-binding protein n=1 Tax=Thiothrix nivea (strain ATCC 35100 / DSM 5205 / JP2) TaxID=870187 RepID=A0A656HGN9_THINJ|nr:hemerythrin family protein [Thiothrix nivea]EIJ34359.1 hemerythrin-like metal-binding protein [Thiothrix nivea DSM 5205]